MKMTNAESRAYQYYIDVAEKEVDWLWFPYIPCGKITILQGDPGEGKSTFMIHLAALLSTGGMLPDGARLQSSMPVIYQCAEDGIQDTIKPRLIQAGADCSKIAFISDADQSLSLDDARIERCIRDTGAKLLVLDPLQAYIKQEGDLQSATRMRSLIRGLASVAERTCCAIVLIGHLNKSTGGKTLYRGLGSIDITAIARSVLMISRDDTATDIRYMHPIKSSLAPEGCAIGFVFDSGTGFHWIGRCLYNQSGKGTVSPACISKKGRAKELLRLILSAEDVRSADALSRLTWLGLSERTIRSAQKELGVKAYRKKNVWYLHLDAVEAVFGEERENV